MNITCPFCNNSCTPIPASSTTSYSCLNVECMINANVSKFELDLYESEDAYIYYDLMFLKNNIYYTFTYQYNQYYLRVYEGGRAAFIIDKVLPGPFTPTTAAKMLEDTRDRFDKLKVFL